MKYYCINFLFLFLFSSAFGNPDGQEKELEHAPLTFDFIQNLGQWEDEIVAKAGIPNGIFFLTEDGFVYNFQSAKDLERINHLHEKGEDMDNEIIHHHAYRVRFMGNKGKSQFKGEDVRDYYHNYFLGNNSEKWKGKVPVYGTVHQRQIYDGINLKVYGTNTLKYDLIVEPHADPGQIQLSYEGVTPILLKSGDLQITTSVNEVIEQKPFSYQMINGQQVIVPSEYVLENGHLSYIFPEGYNQNHPLIIDPSLVFATYSGGLSFDYFSYTSTYDQLGNLYIGTKAMGPGWPTTFGAFQNSSAGNSNVGINKFSADGTALLYSTYYGGNSVNVPHAMIVNQLNELIIIGTTTSSINFPLTNNCFSTTGSTFIAHFDSTGSSLIGATRIPIAMPRSLRSNFISFSINEFITNQLSSLELAIDSLGNIWAVANTTLYGSSSQMISPNALQPNFGGGIDGLIFQMDPTLSNLLYGTHIGGIGSDYIFGIQVNNQGKIVISGATTSIDFPTTQGSFQPTHSGGYDGFTSIIDPISGDLLYSTYLGTSGNDLAIHVQLDDEDNVYVLGKTSGNYPISSGVFNNQYGDIFLQKLSPDLSTSLLSTRLGVHQNANNQFLPTAFMVDRCKNIYISGMRADIGVFTPNSLPLVNPIQNQGSFWFGVLNSSFEDLKFASFFGGGEHTHVGVHRFDPKGIIYHSLCSPSTGFPTSQNAAFPIKKNGNKLDAVSFKFDFQQLDVHAEIGLPAGAKDTGCVSFTVQFENLSTSPDSMTFFWDFGDGATSTSIAPSHTFTQPGIYDVVLHAHSLESCITDSWDTFRITVLDIQLPVVTNYDPVVCDMGGNLNLSFQIQNPNANQVIEWGPLNAIIGVNNQNTVTVNTNISDIFYFQVKDSISEICVLSISDSISVIYPSVAPLDILAPIGVCIGGQATLTATGGVLGDGAQAYWYIDSCGGIPVDSGMSIQVSMDSTTTFFLRFEGDCNQTTCIQTTVHAVPNILYVDSSIAVSGSGENWNEALKTFKEAIDLIENCSSVTEVHVAKGTYYPPGSATLNATRDSTFLISRAGLKFYGGYPSGGGIRDYDQYKSILSGNTRSYHVMVIEGLALSPDSLVIDGFTFEKGRAIGSGQKIYKTLSIEQKNGAGLHIVGNTNKNILIRNSVFKDHEVMGNGGGDLYKAIKSNF